MSLRRIVIAVAVVALLAITWVVYGVISTLRGIPDAYAAWDTGILIIEYLETHEDQWPRSWEQLMTASATLEKNGKHLRGGSSVYGELRSRVSIDWNADPDAIARVEWQGGRLPVRVVTRTDGKEFPVVWEHGEPNEMIWYYLQKLRSD